VRRPWKIKTTHQGVATHSLRTMVLHSKVKSIIGILTSIKKSKYVRVLLFQLLACMTCQKCLPLLARHTVLSRSILT